MNIQRTFPQATRVGKAAHSCPSLPPASLQKPGGQRRSCINLSLFARSASSLQIGEGSESKKTNDFWGAGRQEEGKARKEQLDSERGHWQGHC